MDKFDYDFFPVLLMKLLKKIQKYQSEELSSYGITSFHVMYIMSLYKHKDGMTLKDLSDLIGVNKANTTRVIKDLEAKDYIYKDINKLGERKFKIYLNNKGLELAEFVIKSSDSLRRKILSSFSDEEKETLIKFIEKLNNQNL